VAGVEAEAELLAAMVMFFQNVGLTAQDVAIKLSSRQLLQAVLEQHQVPVDATSRVFVTVDKMDKLPKETVSHVNPKPCNRPCLTSPPQMASLPYGCVNPP